MFLMGTLENIARIFLNNPTGVSLANSITPFLSTTASSVAMTTILVPGVRHSFSLISTGIVTSPFLRPWRLSPSVATPHLRLRLGGRRVYLQNCAHTELSTGAERSAPKVEGNKPLFP